MKGVRRLITRKKPNNKGCRIYINNSITSIQQYGEAH